MFINTPVSDLLSKLSKGSTEDVASLKTINLFFCEYTVKRGPSLTDTQSTIPLPRNCSFADDLELEIERESDLAPASTVSQ